MSSDSTDITTLATFKSLFDVTSGMADLELVLIAAALTGAGLNVLRGTVKSSGEFNPKLFTGGIITAAIAALAAVQVFDVSTLGGITQTILLGLLTGFSADVAISKLKNK
jgi:hypothetical protein